MSSAVCCGLLRSGNHEVAHPANLESLLIQGKQLIQQLQFPTGSVGADIQVDFSYADDQVCSRG